MLTESSICLKLYFESEICTVYMECYLWGDDFNNVCYTHKLK